MDAAPVLIIIAVSVALSIVIALKLALPEKQRRGRRSLNELKGLGDGGAAGARRNSGFVEQPPVLPAPLPESAALAELSQGPLRCDFERGEDDALLARLSVSGHPLSHTFKLSISKATYSGPDHFYAKASGERERTVPAKLIESLQKESAFERLQPAGPGVYVTEHSDFVSGYSGHGSPVTADLKWHCRIDLGAGLVDLRYESYMDTTT